MTEKITCIMTCFRTNKLQAKIDRLVSPYNRANNLERSMNFEVVDTDGRSRNCFTGGFTENNWFKISNLILNQSGDLRKSLRILNKERYREYENISKTMKKLKPKRSICKNRTFYRMQSIRDKEITPMRRDAIAGNHKLSVITKKEQFRFSTTTGKKSFTSSDGGQSFSQYMREDSPIDEGIITRVVSLMKVVNSNTNAESPLSPTPPSKLNSPTLKDNYNTFTGYLKSHLKSPSKTPLKSPSQKALTNIPNTHIPTFQPILQKSHSHRLNLTSRSAPKISIISPKPVRNCKNSSEDANQSHPDSQKSDSLNLTAHPKSHLPHQFSDPASKPAKILSQTQDLAAPQEIQKVTKRRPTLRYRSSSIRLPFQGPYANTTPNFKKTNKFIEQAEKRLLSRDSSRKVLTAYKPQKKNTQKNFWPKIKLQRKPKRSRRRCFALDDIAYMGANPRLKNLI